MNMEILHGRRTCILDSSHGLTWRQRALSQVERRKQHPSPLLGAIAISPTSRCQMPTSLLELPKLRKFPLQK